MEQDSDADSISAAQADAVRSVCLAFEDCFATNTLCHHVASAKYYLLAKCTQHCVVATTLVSVHKAAVSSW